MNPLSIRNVWCVGRNYAEHAQEMKAEKPKSPLFFLKSGNTIETGSVIHLPKWSNNVQHEIELAFWLNEQLQFSHVSLGLDLTARDIQNEAKEKGLPWTKAKSFKGSCPLGSWVSLEDHYTQNKELPQFNFELKKNKKTVQVGSSHEMLFSPSVLLQEAQKFYPVAPFDILLTGTPAGVSTLHIGDQLEATLQSENRTILTCFWDVQ